MMSIDTGVPLPDTLPLAAPPWLFWSLLLLTFFLHLLPMNFILGGSMLGAISWYRGRGEGPSHHRAIAQWLARSMPVAFAATVTFGVAPLLFVQVLYGRLLYTSSILMGWFWLLLIVFLVLAYYGTYGISFRTRGRGVLAVCVPLLVLLAAFTLSNNMSLMLRPDVFPGKYLDNPGGTWLNLDDATLFPRYLHTVLGAVALAGIALAVWGNLKRRRDPELGHAIFRYGLMVFAIVTAVNFVLGTVFLLSFPQDVLLAFMKGGLLGPVSLLAGFIGGLVAIPLAILAAQEKQPSRWFPWVVGSLAATLITMILVRDAMRTVSLGTRLEPVTWVAPQWGAIAVFFVLLVAALATVVGMVWVLARSQGGADTDLKCH
jgi:hypothetical protein